MAGRPIERRTNKTFKRDVEAIRRLRASIQLNESGETSLEAIDACNRIIAALLELMHSDDRKAA